MTNIPLPVQQFIVKEDNCFHYFIKISWRCGDGKYLPLTFLVDTGAVADFLITQNTMDILEAHGVLGGTKKDRTVEIVHETLETPYIAECRLAPKSMSNVNLIGLKFILKFGFELIDDERWRFGVDFTCF